MPGVNSVPAGEVCTSAALQPSLAPHPAGILALLSLSRSTCTLCFVPAPKDPMLRLILQIGLCKSSFWEQEDLAPCQCR